MRKLIAGTALLAASLGCSAQTVGALQFTAVVDGGLRCCDYRKGMTENANFFDDQAYLGFAEFDLSGLGASSGAVVSFRYAQGSQGPRYPGASSVASPATGEFSFAEYAGLNVPHGYRNFGPDQGLVGRADIGTMSVGDLLSFDVTTLYNQAIGRGDAAFGIRVSGSGVYGSAPVNDMVAFDSFQLSVGAVPEPGTFGLMLAGMAVVGFAARRRSKQG